MSTKPIPILLSGGTELVGRVVVGALKPEYEVIHFVLVPHITDELPLLLQNRPPSSPSSTLGSGNWSVRPKAVVFGGQYRDTDIERLQNLISQTDGAMRIPWLRVDTSKPAPPGPSPEYGAAIVKRTKEALERLRKEGKFEGDYGEGGLFWI